MSALFSRPTGTPVKIGTSRTQSNTDVLRAIAPELYTTALKPKMFETVEYINVDKSPELIFEHILYLGTNLAKQPVDVPIKWVDVKTPFIKRMKD